MLKNGVEEGIKGFQERWPENTNSVVLSFVKLISKGIMCERSITYHSFERKLREIFGPSTADIFGGSHKKGLTLGHNVKACELFPVKLMLLLERYKEENRSWVIHPMKNVSVY